jgi:hypothetical protein
MTTNTTPAVEAMIDGRRADSTRRRQRVLSALDIAINDGAELSVTSIARRAGVDRTFLYRHRDLLERIHAAETQPLDKPEIGPAVTRASLQADLLAAQQRCTRMTVRTQQLETRLSELVGEQAWRATGLGAPTDIEQLQQRILTLETTNRRATAATRRTRPRPRRRPCRQPRTHGPAQRLPADRLKNKCLHHTCCAPYSSAASRANCGNAGALQQLRPRPQENRQHSALGCQTPVHYAAWWAGSGSVVNGAP